VATSGFLVKFHYDLLVFGNGEFLHREDGAFVLVACHTGSVVIGTERENYLLLNGSPFGDLLIHDFERDKIHIERHVGRVLNLRVEIQQPVVRVHPTEQVLDAERLRPDMLDFTLVVLVDGLHYQMHQLWGLAAQLLQIDVEGVVRAVYRTAVMDKIFHLHVQE